MNPTVKTILGLLIFLILIGGCKQAYVSPHKSPPTGYLVVEGYITGNGPTQFVLSRTIALPGDSAIPVETNAQVQVEGDDNSSYPLADQGGGHYFVASMPLNATAKYRLRIQTANGETYLSDFVQYKPTPAIDSINWIQNGNGVQIYANTHDATNNTRYYQWQYEETWEYHSGEVSYYKFLADTNPVSVVLRNMPADQIYRCWHNEISTSLLLGSSAKLAQDEIFRHPLNLIPSNSQQLGVLYSMLVRQYALTEDGYNYLTLMQKNTESLGSIFDVQPSVLRGNIHSLTNPDEQVIGYISAGTVQQQRIFIYGYQVSPWYYSFTCPIRDTMVPLDAESLQFFFSTLSYIPVDMHYNMATGRQDSWLANQSYCIDCRYQGGTLTKPTFWPN